MTDRDGDFEIYSVARDGSNPTNLTNNAAVDGLPTWSDQARAFAFAHLMKLDAPRSDPVRRPLRLGQTLEDGQTGAFDITRQSALGDSLLDS